MPSSSGFTEQSSAIPGAWPPHHHHPMRICSTEPPTSRSGAYLAELERGDSCGAPFIARSRRSLRQHQRLVSPSSLLDSMRGRVDLQRARQTTVAVPHRQPTRFSCRRRSSSVAVAACHTLDSSAHSSSQRRLGWWASAAGRRHRRRHRGTCVSSSSLLAISRSRTSATRATLSGGSSGTKARAPLYSPPTSLAPWAPSRCAAGQRYGFKLSPRGSSQISVGVTA